MRAAVPAPADAAETVQAVAHPCVRGIAAKLVRTPARAVVKTPVPALVTPVALLVREHVPRPVPEGAAEHAHLPVKGPARERAKDHVPAVVGVIAQEDVIQSALLHRHEVATNARKTVRPIAQQSVPTPVKTSVAVHVEATV